ncbi:hypothetical protein ABAC402_06870 [Asticcacaulis sp. AC402]|nr:hypothetical protein ABAC402_06870 [Asticcacaulis sp. AC402]
MAGIDLDVSVFLLTATGKVRDDSDMCFYGQPEVARGAVQLDLGQPDKPRFTLNLAALDPAIEKVAVTATIHDNKARFGAYSDIIVQVGADIQATIATAGKTETALILGEFYRRHGEWKFRCLGLGYDGGLAPLATGFGVVIETAPTPAPAGMSLEKTIAEKAPRLVSLVKKAAVSLEKKRLSGVRARVALVLDTSGSMDGQYRKGRVQEIVDRLLPLAVHFDDDQSLECWAFAQKPVQLSSINLANFSDFIEKDNLGWKRWNIGPRSNNEPAVIDAVVKFYRKSSSKVPVYILFISDGGVSESRRIAERITEAAKLPLFWQFVGIAGRSYGILERLDDMAGRVVDNCNFFAIDDLHAISEDELYDRLMEEFPAWLKDARAKGIIDG